LKRYDTDSEHVLQLLVGFIKIRIFFVHFADKEHFADARLVHQMHGFFGSDFNTVLSGKYNDCTFGGSYALYDLTYKIKVSRCIDKINFNVLPFNRSDGCVYRKVSFDFFRVEIHCRISAGDLSHSGDSARIEQHRFY
jgi:hypothetical protein